MDLLTDHYQFELLIIQYFIRFMINFLIMRIINLNQNWFKEPCFILTFSYSLKTYSIDLYYQQQLFNFSLILYLFKYHFINLLTYRFKTSKNQLIYLHQYHASIR